MDYRNIGVTALAAELQISKQSVSAYINGKRKPKRLLLSEISKVLNVDPAWLMGYDTNMIPQESDRAGEQLQASSEAVIPFNITLTNHEQELILAYRTKSEMQSAVDTLLGIQPNTVSIADDMAFQLSKDFHPAHTDTK